jgi:tetratricopeptide (TPR) repeat protein
MRFLLVIAWLLTLATSSVPSFAADPSPTNSTDLARQRFQEATEAYREGRYATAASLFEAADRLAPWVCADARCAQLHASTRYNAATAWDQAGEAARAATGYESALALETLDAGRRQQADERLELLRQTLGRVSIQQPVGAFITVDHMQRAPVPAVFYLRPGNYDIAVDYEGEGSVTHTQVAGGKAHEITLDLPASSQPAAIEPPAGALTPDPVPAPPTDSGATQKTLGWIGVGAGVALSGAAIIFGVRALSARDRYDDSGHTDAAARDEAADLRLATNVLWGGATLAGATGLVLLLTAPTVEF